MLYDIAVIGGGINGSAIAADAAGRGLSVFLCEKNDVASGTSSASSKLIHGGLRYLESFDFRLVSESLRERKILLQRAPHLVQPLSFVMPDNTAYHSPLLVRLGLVLYDFLASDKQLPHSKRINLADLPFPSHLKKQTKGYQYVDCWGDDARLVVANLQLAREKGAVIETRMELLKASQENTAWVLHFNRGENIHAKALVNAAGPWVEQVRKRLLPGECSSFLRLVKGSHIIIKRFYAGDHAYTLQNEDGRIIFLIPFQDDLLIVGTTDILYDDSLEAVSMSEEEEAYLIKSVEYYFDINVAEMIQRSYSGVRALYDKSAARKPSQMTRDYFLQLEEISSYPLLTVYGGKLTTHRSLAENVLQKLRPYFPAMRASWTRDEPLPGGKTGDFEKWTESCHQRFAWVPTRMLKRLLQTYGSNIDVVLGSAKKLGDLGVCFGADLFESEVQYLIEQEWAQTVDDILWRRTKLGLYLTAEQKTKLMDYIFDAHGVTKNRHCEERSDVAIQSGNK